MEVKYSKEPDNPTNSVAVEAQENGPRRAKAEAQVEARRKKDFEREPTHHTLLKTSSVWIGLFRPAVYVVSPVSVTDLWSTVCKKGLRSDGRFLIRERHPTVQVKLDVV
ncbi:hypothetical protein Tco_0238617 [Tanacetum coccineum]